MKENECVSTLQTSLRWQLSAFFIWSLPVIYFYLYLSHMLLLYPPVFPSFLQLLKFYILISMLCGFKYLTFTNTPDVSSHRNELRKLFTSISPFHMLIIASSVLYNLLFKELSIILGFYRLNAWGSSLSTACGVFSAISYLLRHEYVNYWYDPPYSRIVWVIKKAPEVLAGAAIANSAFVVLMNILWAVARYELPGMEYWTFGVIVYFIDMMQTKMMQNFLAMPTRLDDENHLGEELAICGMMVKDSDVHFQCFQDLNRASRTRKEHIMDPKSAQWPLMLETGVQYIQKVSKHIQSYSSVKPKETPYKNELPVDLKSFIAYIAKGIYFVFNEPFELKFRSELFKSCTMAVLTSKVLTKFVTTNEFSGIVLKDNTLSLLIQAQAESINEIDNFYRIDNEILHKKFKESMLANLKDIRRLYSDYLQSIPLRSDTLNMLYNIG